MVYVVMEDFSYEGDAFRGVFSSREAAEAWIARQGHAGEFYVIEAEVDREEV